MCSECEVGEINQGYARARFEFYEKNPEKLESLGKNEMRNDLLTIFESLNPSYQNPGYATYFVDKTMKKVNTKDDFLYQLNKVAEI